MDKKILFILFLFVLTSCEKYVLNDANSTYTFTGVSISLDGNVSATSYNIGWTNLSNYPSDCPSGQFVTGVNDTLDCATPSIGTDASLWNKANNDTAATLAQLELNLSRGDYNRTLKPTDWQVRIKGNCSIGSSYRGFDNDGNIVCESDDSGASNINGTDVNLTNLNVVNINGTPLSDFNKSVMLGGYITTSGLISFNNSVFSKIAEFFPSNLTAFNNSQTITIFSWFATNNTAQQVLVDSKINGNISRVLKNNTDVNFTFIQSPQINGTIFNGTNFTGGINCNQLYGGSDSDFCADTSGTGGMPVELDYRNNISGFFGSDRDINNTVLTRSNLSFFSTFWSIANDTASWFTPWRQQNLFYWNATQIMNDTIMRTNYTTFFIKSGDFDLRNISNNTLTKVDNFTTALWNKTGLSTIATRDVNVVNFSNDNLTLSTNTTIFFNTNKTITTYANNSCYVIENTISGNKFTLC